MNNLQLYLAMGVPSLVALVGILVNTVLFSTLGHRIGYLEQKFDTRFDMLMGKIDEIDNRLTRLEERFEGWKR